MTAVPEILWEPSTTRVSSSRLTDFTRWLSVHRGVTVDTYDALWAWSVNELEDFWLSIWEYFKVSGEYGGSVLGIHDMPATAWFPGSRVNFAEHLTRLIADSDVAVVWRNDEGDRRELTGADLRHQAATLASTLRSHGIGPGDVVAGYLPNIPETLVAFMAAASIGAVWTNCAPEFGTPSVLDRLRQVAPRALIFANGYTFGGRQLDRQSEAAEIIEGLPSVVLAIRVPYPASLDEVPRSKVVSWEQATAENAPWDPVRLDFSHPLWILYSSGTSGLPKALVHSHGGVLLEQFKSHGLHLNLSKGDTFHWSTSTGWVMWNLQIAGLLLGARIVLFDGNPLHPTADAIWSLAEAEGVSTLGAGASLFESQMLAGLKPSEHHQLSALSCVGSTGSPLSPAGYRWIHQAVKGDVWLMSFSGGTDVATAFVGGNPNLPVRLGEIQCRWLGVAAEAWTDDGKVTAGVGELVITQPMPSMPVGLVNDPDGRRYRESYFGVFPKVWRHGDWIEFTTSGGAIIHGRSDATINRRGVRMGTSEIYNALASFDGVLDALAVDVTLIGPESRLIVFIVTEVDVQWDDRLLSALRQHIKRVLSPRHLPDVIQKVPDIPRTLNGKKMEIPVKRLLEGADVATVLNPDSMSNPEVIEEFVRIAQELTVKERLRLPAGF
jgi:acetoacetyl-CoA synthetase